ncbi:MAG: response regulator [Acidimicrobiia bacterium]|nr:response regulator [Acidimicrobiia bacterium]
MATAGPAPERPVLSVEGNPADVELDPDRCSRRTPASTCRSRSWRTVPTALDHLLGRPPFEDATRPVLVLLDLRLPRLDGTAVLDRIRANEALRDLPVVLLTADDDPGAALGGRPDRSDGHIRKPVEADALRELARRFGLV